MNIKDKGNASDKPLNDLHKNTTKNHHEDRSLKVFYRAANEDDDGYDPYSDRPADNPLFEKDPWD